jgi:pimeloyl-ACP methyl ester carboxylesterase
MIDCSRDHILNGLFVKEFLAAGEGRANPILMIHGGFHGWWAFEEWLPLFAAWGWPSYALSLRNHTDSYSTPDQEFLKLTLADYVADALEVLKWLDKPPILIGHSMGGVIAQKIAEEERLAALVLLAPVGPGQLGPIRGPLPTDRRVVRDPVTVRRQWFYDIDDERLKAIYARLVEESPSALNEYGSKPAFVDRSKIHCPILVLAGEYDRSGVHSPEAVADFYHAPCWIVPNCGHDLMLEPVAAEVASKIKTWLKRRGQICS